MKYIFIGTIPATIGSLMNIQGLYLNQNSFTGNVHIVSNVKNININVT